MVLTDADKIQALEAAHQSIIDHKAEYEDLYYAEANGTKTRPLMRIT